MKTILIFSMLIFFQSTLFAQDEDAWVYLTNKANVETALANPTSILTQQAINRKNAHGVVIDARDVPVNEAYITQLKSATGITVKAKSKWFNAVHVRGSQTNITNLLTSFSFIDHIEFANRSLNTTTKSVKQKQQSKFLNVLTNYTYGTAANQVQMINAHQLHQSNYTGSGITVAVLDAGFPNVNTMNSFQYLRNANNILGTYDFVNRNPNVYASTADNHGTLVLSTMAGYVENEFVGTAPDAAYYLFVTEAVSSENPVEESYWVEAAERADSLGVHIINSSLGYFDYDNASYNYTASDMNGTTAYITRGANIAFEKGILIVNSAGNSGNSGVNAPADSPNVLSVGAVNASGNYVSFSSVGNSFQPTQKPDVVAQGQSSAIITQNNVISSSSGTSFSAPILAGGVACLWQALPNKTNAEIMQLVRESASQFNTPNNFLGYGIPNLQLALSNSISINNTAIDALKLFPNPIKNTIYFEIPQQQQPLFVMVFDITGKQVLAKNISFYDNKIDVSYLTKGLYIFRVMSEKTSKNIKVIKE